MLTPDVDPMPPDQHRRRIRILPHRLRHAIRQILLVRRILNDGDLEGIMIRERLADSADTDALDHFLVGDAEGRLAVFCRVEEGEHD